MAATYVLGSIEFDVSATHEIRPRANEAPPRAVSVHLAADSPARIGVLASRDDAGGVRAALWQLPRFATTDERLADAASARRVRLHLPAAPHGWQLTITAPRGTKLPAGGPPEHLAIGWAKESVLERVRLTADDHVDLEVEPASLYVIDAAPLAEPR